MPINQKYDEKELLLAIQDTKGIAQNLTATSVLLTQDLEFDPFEGEEEVLNFDGRNNDLRDKPISINNPTNNFSFKSLVTFPDNAGELPTITPLIRMCGADAIQHDDRVVFTTSSAEALDLGTVMMLRSYDSTRDYQYPTYDCTGIFGFEFIMGKKPVFKVSNLTGKFITPDIAATIQTDYQRQKMSISENLMSDIINECTLNDKRICARSITTDNLWGWDFKSEETTCATDNAGDAITPVISLEFKQTDWNSDSEDNPFKIALKTGNFAIDFGKAQGRSLRLEVERVQFTKPKEIKSEIGNVFIKLDLRLLSKPRLIFK